MTAPTIPAPALADERARAWWDAMPDLHASGTAFKGWLQACPPGIPTRDRRAAHEAIVEHLAPLFPIARDLSRICVLRRP